MGKLIGIIRIESFKPRKYLPHVDQEKFEGYRFRSEGNLKIQAKMFTGDFFCTKFLLMARKFFLSRI